MFFFFRLILTAIILIFVCFGHAWALYLAMILLTIGNELLSQVVIRLREEVTELTNK